MAVRFCRAAFMFGAQNGGSKVTRCVRDARVLLSCRTCIRRNTESELEACGSTGLMALRERNPAIKDISFDVDGMTVAKANTKVEDTPVKTIVIGDAYLEKGKQDTRRTFLCLIGEKGKVLLTFFTDK